MNENTNYPTIGEVGAALEAWALPGWAQSYVKSNYKICRATTPNHWNLDEIRASGPVRQSGIQTQGGAEGPDCRAESLHLGIGR